MNKIVGKGYVENIIKGLSYLNYEDCKQIKTRLAYEIIKDIVKGEFNRYGEILNYDVNKDLIFNSEDCKYSEEEYGVGEKLDDLELSLIVIKLKKKIIIKEAVEAGSFYEYIRTGETLGYIENKKVWLRFGRKDEYITKGLAELNLVFLNNVENEINNAVYKYVLDNFNTFVEMEEVKNKILEYKDECKKRNSDNPFAVMSRLESEVKMYLSLRNVSGEKSFEELVEIYKHKNISELSDKIACKLIYKECFESVEEMIDIYIDNNDAFWELVKSKIVNSVIKQASYEYANMLGTLETVEGSIKHLDKYNLAKKLNNIVCKTMTSIRESMNKAGNSVKTLGYETEMCDVSIPASFRIRATECQLNDFVVYLDTITVEDKYTEERIFGCGRQNTFKLKYRKKTIFELDENVLNEYKETFEMLKED